MRRPVDVTMDDLRRNGFSESILRSLAAVTKTAAEHAAKDDDSYFRFVARAAADGIGRHVKRADLEDNLDESRIANPTEKDRERLARYREAIARLDDSTPCRQETAMPIRERKPAKQPEDWASSHSMIDPNDGLFKLSVEDRQKMPKALRNNRATRTCRRGVKEGVIDYASRRELPTTAEQTHLA